MLNIKLLKRFTSIGLVLAGMAVSSAQAASFNIDFGSKYRTGEESAPYMYGAAAGPAGVGYWNQISSSTPPDLRDLDNQIMDAVLTFGPPQPFGNVSGAPATGYERIMDQRLMNDYFYTSGRDDNWSLSITGNDIIGTYDLYYYAPMGSNVDTGAFTVNGQQVSSLSGDRNNRVIEDQKDINWAVLEGLKIDSLGLLLDFTTVKIAGKFHGLSGLQLIETASSPSADPGKTLSPVPLPAGFWLFGTALAGLLGFKKSRKTA